MPSRPPTAPPPKPRAKSWGLILLTFAFVFSLLASTGRAIFAFTYEERAEGPEPPPVAAADAGQELPDAGFDAGHDAGSDAGVDAGFDAGFDAGAPRRRRGGAWWAQ